MWLVVKQDAHKTKKTHQQDAQYTANNREEARKAGRLTYGDGKGNEYLVSTGEKVYTHDGKIYSTKHYDIMDLFFMMVGNSIIWTEIQKH